MSTVTGLHHVSVLSGAPQETLDFYIGVLGLRLVKRTVNQDAPSMYHLFFADGAGTPGTELTFFPWPGAPRGRAGAGLTTEVALAVPAGTLDAWGERLATHGVAAGPEEVRFGERALPFTDPHGLALALVETADAREFTPWAESPVPAAEQVRGLHGVRLDEAAPEATARFLDAAFGWTLAAEEGAWRRYAPGGDGTSGRVVDVRAAAADAPRALQAVGTVHHVAFRVADDAAELAARERARAAGAHPTEVIDRFWFRSVYFREPGGVLFELATDGPGFAVDEDPASLGGRLVLPPFLEGRRAEIERGLPAVTVPAPQAAA